MGKLIEKLTRAMIDTGPRMGFGSASSNGQAALFIVAAVEGGDKAAAQAAVAAGAGAVLASAVSAKGKGRLGEALGLGENTPVGGAVKEAKESQVAQVDFVAFGPADNAEAALGAEIDRVLSIPNDASDALYRTLEALPVEAFIAESPLDAVTVEALVPYYRAVVSTQKPVLARVAVDADAKVLRALRDAGIVGLVVAVTAENAKQVAGLKAAIAGLPPKKKKVPHTRPSVSLGLSALGGERSAPAPDEDDDEE